MVNKKFYLLGMILSIMSFQKTHATLEQWHLLNIENLICGKRVPDPLTQVPIDLTKEEDQQDFIACIYDLIDNRVNLSFWPIFKITYPVLETKTESRLISQKDHLMPFYRYTLRETIEKAATHVVFQDPSLDFSAVKNMYKKLIKFFLDNLHRPGAIFQINISNSILLEDTLKFVDRFNRMSIEIVIGSMSIFDTKANILHPFSLFETLAKFRKWFKSKPLKYHKTLENLEFSTVLKQVKAYRNPNVRDNRNALNKIDLEELYYSYQKALKPKIDFLETELENPNYSLESAANRWKQLHNA